MNAARRAGTTTVATATAVSLCLATIHLVAPNWMRAVGLDIWSVTSLHEQLESANRKDEVLTEAIADSDRRFETKATLIENLLNGRATLREVAGEFLVLNRGRVCMQSIRLHYRGKTDEENAARNVLDFALRKLREANGPHAVLPAELSGQFHDWFGTAYVADPRL